MKPLGSDSRLPRANEVQPSQEIYRDRFDAGRQLAKGLSKYRRRKTLFVLAISSQGVEVAISVAQTLHAPVDLVISSLLPIPAQPQASFGAVVEDTVVVDDGLVRLWSLSSSEIAHIVADARHGATDRMLRLRGSRPLPDLKGKTVIITDDGLAIGFPILAAVEWTLKQKPRGVVAAIPVAPRHEIDRLAQLVSEVVCPIQRDTWNLFVAAFYRVWTEPSDDEVASLLRQAQASPSTKELR